MRHLKKVLAMTLVFAMAFAMMAGAAFSDQSSVTAADEVNLVSALNIMKGYPDGSFKPANNITRAEAAKMLYVISAGKDEGSERYISSNSFSDVSSSHWASGYINADYARKIVAGTGAGRFNPEGKLTGLELAKMLLITIGYDPAKSGLVGPNWAINTMNLALENDLFDGYTGDVGAAASREAAAIMFDNALYADMVKYSNDAEDYTKTGETVAEKYFNLEEHEGVLLAADDFSIAVAAVGEDEIAVDVDEDGVIDAAEKFEFEGGRDMVGQTVKVLYDAEDEEVINIVASEDTVVHNVTLGDIDKVTTEPTQIKFGGKYYDVAATAKVYKNYANFAFGGGIAGLIAELDINSGNPVRIVDTDDDGELDLFFVNIRTFSYVSTLDSKSIDFGLGVKKLLNSDGDTLVHADGIEEGDYVYYWVDTLGAEAIHHLAKVPSVTAEIEAVQSDNTTIYMNGASKSMYKAVDDLATLVDELDEATQGTPATGDTYRVFMDGKYWIAALAEDEATAAGNYALVLDSLNEVAGLGGNAAEVSVLIPGEDGTVDYELNEDSEVAGVKVNLGAIGGMEGKIFAYEIKSDGTILLTQDIDNLTDSAEFAYNEDADLFTARDAAANNGDYLLADDAVIFYLWDVSEAANENGWEIYSASDFDTTFNTDAGNDTADASVFGFTTSGGFKYINCALIANDADTAKQGGGESDDMYGFLTVRPVLGTDSDDVDYVKYTVFTKDGAKTYMEMDTHTINAGVDRKDFVKFNLKSDGTIKDASLDDGIANGAFGDITAYSSSTSRITIGGTIYNITEDTQVVYVDYDAVAGTTGSGFPKISAADAGAYSNCYFVHGTLDEANDIMFIAIDTGASVGLTMPN